VSNPGGFTRAVTALGGIEDRLRRYLKLVGEVGTSFTPAVAPIVLAGNATEPGNNLVQGRRWGGTMVLTSAAASSLGIKFAQDCIVDGFDLYGSTAGADLSCRLAPPDAGADPFAIATLSCVWLELADRNADRAPIFNSAVNAGAGLGVPFWRCLISISGLKSYTNSFHCKSGTRLFFDTVNAAGIGLSHLNIWGRVV
jgi:hypothetical protein